MITLRSYRDYALNRDATHSSTGRVSRNDKDRDTINLKLIEVDDAALQKKAQRALDRLIKFINQKKFKEWVESDVYSKTRDLLLWNTELFDEFYPIDKNPRVYLMLVPMIRKAQYDLLLSRVGADFFDEFLKKVKAGKLSDKSDILLFSLMGWPVAEMAMAEAIVKLPVQLFPEKIIQQFWGPGNGASALVLRETMVKELKEQCKESLNRLETELNSRKSEEDGVTITDETIVDITDRMVATNLYARV